MLPYPFGYTVNTEDPLDEAEFERRLPWLQKTQEAVNDGLLVRYSSFLDLGMEFMRQGLIPVEVSGSGGKAGLKPQKKHLKARATEFAAELRTLHFHVPWGHKRNAFDLFKIYF